MTPLLKRRCVEALMTPPNRVRRVLEANRSTAWEFEGNTMHFRPHAYQKAVTMELRKLVLSGVLWNYTVNVEPEAGSIYVVLVVEFQYEYAADTLRLGLRSKAVVRLP